MHNVDLGRQPPSLQMWHPSFFPQVDKNYPCGQLGSGVLAASSPSSLCLPSLLSGGVGWEAERGSVLCTAHIAMTKTSLYCHCHLQHKNPQNTVAMTKLTPPNPKQAHGAGVQKAFRPFKCCIRVVAVQTKAEPSPNSCPPMKLQNEEDLAVSQHPRA